MREADWRRLDQPKQGKESKVDNSPSKGSSVSLLSVCLKIGQEKERARALRRRIFTTVVSVLDWLMLPWLN